MFGIYERKLKSRSRQNVYALMFFAVLLVLAKVWKHLLVEVWNLRSIGCVFMIQTYKRDPPTCNNVDGIRSIHIISVFFISQRLLIFSLLLLTLFIY